MSFYRPMKQWRNTAAIANHLGVALSLLSIATLLFVGLTPAVRAETGCADGHSLNSLTGTYFWGNPECYRLLDIRRNSFLSYAPARLSGGGSWSSDFEPIDSKVYLWRSQKMEPQVATLDPLWWGGEIGSCTFSSGELTLTPKNKDARIMKLIPVTWGNRQYLVDENHILDFCNGVNNGWEPQHGGDYPLAFESAYLRIFDEDKPITGLPDLPKKWMPYILKEPVTGKIVGVTGFTATVNRGSADGLKVGMLLILREDKKGQRSLLKVTKTSRRTCTVGWYIPGDDPWDYPNGFACGEEQVAGERDLWREVVPGRVVTSSD